MPRSDKAKLTSKPKLTPTEIRRRLHKISDQIEDLNRLYSETKARCSHKGTMSRFVEYEDSGFDCSACGATWSRWPEGVPTAYMR